MKVAFFRKPVKSLPVCDAGAFKTQDEFKFLKEVAITKMEAAFDIKIRQGINLNPDSIMKVRAEVVKAFRS